ncbi:MAG: hypothetical protein LBS86_06910 [Treponema sp.]|nr:hypothetical protein [Treponema sp.]
MRAARVPVETASHGGAENTEEEREGGRNEGGRLDGKVASTSSATVSNSRRYAAPPKRGR